MVGNRGPPFPGECLPPKLREDDRITELPHLPSRPLDGAWRRVLRVPRSPILAEGIFSSLGGVRGTKHPGALVPQEISTRRDTLLIEVGD